MQINVAGFAQKPITNQVRVTWFRWKKTVGWGRPKRI